MAMSMSNNKLKYESQNVYLSVRKNLLFRNQLSIWLLRSDKVEGKLDEKFYNHFSNKKQKQLWILIL